MTFTPWPIFLFLKTKSKTGIAGQYQDLNALQAKTGIEGQYQDLNALQA